MAEFIPAPNDEEITIQVNGISVKLYGNDETGFFSCPKGPWLPMNSYVPNAETPYPRSIEMLRERISDLETQVTGCIQHINDLEKKMMNLIDAKMRIRDLECEMEDVIKYIKTQKQEKCILITLDDPQKPNETTEPSDAQSMLDKSMQKVREGLLEIMRMKAT